ncbi:MAG: ATPase [Saprospirales bacterium]|nr:ATPase [Saprospirales bacterium]
MEIKRHLLPKLREHLSQKEITLLVGARQVGKTTLLQQLRSELDNAGARTLFFNLDVEADAAHFGSQQRFLAKVSLETGGERSYIFIDEIQRKENAGLFLKGIYDLGLPHKLVVSGSGSLELKEKIHESLAGRKRIFELYPVSFAEFLNYRTGYRYEGRLSMWMESEPEQSRILLLEYLNFGGYPRVVVAGPASEKRLILQELYNSYLEKDLATLLRLEKTQAFTLLFRLLADRIGQSLNYSGLSRETALSQPTVKQYIWYAEKTFMIELLPPFFRNAGKELTKSPQVYFNDLGMRNSALGLAGRLDNLATMGMLFQNFIFHNLRSLAEKEFLPLRFWRTKDQAEVDFVFDKTNDTLPVEVKCIDLSAPVVPKSLRSFINSYQPREAWMVNLSLEEEVQVNGTLVRFIPWWKLISE